MVHVDGSVAVQEGSLLHGYAAQVCSLISKTAFPVSKAHVGPLNFISLEALLAILTALAQR